MYNIIPIEQVRNKIDGETFDYSQLMSALSSYSKPRDTVTTLLKRGHILRVRKGLYVFGPVWRRVPVNTEPLANLVYGPSSISLDFALAAYGLIPERVNVITSVTNGRSREFDTPEGRFTYTHLSGIRFSTGIALQGSTGSRFFISEPLKALADKVWTDSRFKPVSAGSYADYLFSDLRIDEDTLASYIRTDRINVIKHAYATRKISWLMEYLLKRFNSVL